MEEAKIVVTKIKKIGHKGGHGGSSWKVAYADFVTALMAFFLLLWLITMVAPEKQARVSHYFKHFSLFERSGASIIGKKSAIKLSEGVIEQDQKGQDAQYTRDQEELSPEEKRQVDFKIRLKQELDKRLANVKDQVLVDIFERGVRVEVVDKDGSSMFPTGSAKLNPQAKEILKVIYESIEPIGAKIAIEGHTDAYSYSTNRYTNWELSTERASSCRKELESLGLNPDRIVRVSGFAATDPLIKENPFDPRNRRIRFLLYFQERVHPRADTNNDILPKVFPVLPPSAGNMVSPKKNPE